MFQISHSLEFVAEILNIYVKSCFQKHKYFSNISFLVDLEGSEKYFEYEVSYYFLKHNVGYF